MIRTLVLLLMSSTLFGHGIDGHEIEGLDTLGFTSPVDHTIKLTGNFMELRPNHFHAGIDIKSTNGQSGDVIKSTHDGHISRIKIQSGGYGNALYIDHPNGYTSVYAHLSAFTPELEAYVKSIQYALETFEVDIYLESNQFSFSQGEKIGEMGNTGRSFGPHLHFEIRETKSEKPINPEYFGIGPTDERAPVLESLHLHNLSSSGEITSKTVKYFKPKTQGYKLYQDTITTTSKKLGLAMQMFDRMDGSWNKNGIYGFELRLDDSLAFGWRADEFSFDETRYINAFWDYERKQVHGQKVYLLYKSACNPFSYYDSQKTGVIDLSHDVDKRVDVRVFDLHGNESHLSFVISASPGSLNDTSDDSTKCDSILSQEAGYFEVEFGKNSFFSPLSIDINYNLQKIEGKNRPSISIGEDHIPVNGKYLIHCPIPTNEPLKWTLVKKRKNGNKAQFAADTVGGRLLARVDELGTFCLYKDTIPPTIEPISFSRSLSSPWKIKVSDNLVPDALTKDISFRATLNDNWILMKYDAKNDMLSFSDKDRLGSGKMIFKLWVRDHCGNVSRYEREI